MKFTSTKDNLSRAINIVANLAIRSIGLPVLGNISFTVKDDGLELVSTNLEIGIRTQVRGKAEKNGAFNVRAKVLLDYINLLPEGNVELELIKDQLTIKCANFSTKLKGQSNDDFPIVPHVKNERFISLPLADTRDTLEHVIFAVSNDDMRPEIGGALFLSDNEKLLVVATDSYRLAERKISSVKEIRGLNFTLPLKTLQEVARIAGLVDSKEVKIFYDDNQVEIKFDATSITSRLIDGDYPDYQQIIPEQINTRVKIHRSKLIQAIKAAALFSKTGINDVDLLINEKEGVVVKSSNTQIGEQEVRMEATVVGPSEKITFNYRYLLEGLQVMTGEFVQVEINSSSSPVVLRDEADGDYLYLIMPIKN
jgi:DNA polymerase III subunit beta